MVCGHFDIKDARRFGRPTVENDETILEIVHSNHHMNQIAETLQILQKTVWQVTTGVGATRVVTNKPYKRC